MTQMKDSKSKELKKTAEYLDQLVESCTLNVEKFESSKIFFNQLLMCIKEDVYEFIKSIQKKARLPKQISLSPQPPKLDMDESVISKIFAYFAIYNIVCFLKQDGGKFDNSMIESQFFAIFDLSDEQISIYTYFVDKFARCDGYFKEEYSKVIYKSIFHEELQSVVLLANMTHALYNSYKGVIESYTNYIPFNSLSEDML